jgi:hypothetical protein
LSLTNLRHHVGDPNLTYHPFVVLLRVISDPRHFNNFDRRIWERHRQHQTNLWSEESSSRMLVFSHRLLSLNESLAIKLDGSLFSTPEYQVPVDEVAADSPSLARAALTTETIYQDEYPSKEATISDEHILLNLPWYLSIGYNLTRFPPKILGRDPNNHKTYPNQ